MKRQRITIVSATMLFALASLLAFAFWPGEREPEYQGIKVSDWLIIHAWAKDGRDRRLQESEAAIRHFGTKAIPFIIRDIEYDWTPRRLRLGRIVDRSPI